MFANTSITSNLEMMNNPWEKIASLIREAGKGPQGWNSPAAAAAAAAAEARAAATAASEGVFSSPSSTCVTPLAPEAARRLDVEVQDTVAAAAALLELSTGRKRRLTFDASTDCYTLDSEEAASPPVQFHKPSFKETDADGLSDGHSDLTYMQGSPNSTAVSKQQRLSPPSVSHTPLSSCLGSPTTPGSGSPASASAAAAAAAAAAAVNNAGTAPPPLDLSPHQRRVQLHMIEQMLDATNTKFSTNNGVVAPRKFWPRLEGGDTAPTQLQVLVHPPSWVTADYVTCSLERLATAVIANDSAAVAADDGSTIAYAMLWKHYLEQTESDELHLHHRMLPNSKGNLHAATASGHTLVFGPYPALVVAGGSMMRIRGIKHNGELKLLINTPHTLVLREKLGAHLLRLHVVLNTPDGEAAVGNRQAELAAMTGKGREQGQASNMSTPQPPNKHMLMQQAVLVGRSPSSRAPTAGTPPPAKQLRRMTSPAPATPSQHTSSTDTMPQLLALAGEMAAAAAAAAGVNGQAAGNFGPERSAVDMAQAIAAAMAALRRRQEEVEQQQHHAME